jgi:hypothetical protein
MNINVFLNGGVYMGIVITIAIFIVFGILLSKLAGLIGSRIFRFSDIYKFFQKLNKKTEDK